MVDHDRRFVIATSITVLVLVLTFPRLTFVQSVLLLPSFLSLAILAIATTVIILAVRTDQHVSQRPPSTLFTRQRHALRHLTFTTSSAWSAVLIRQNWEEGTSTSWRVPIYGLGHPIIAQRLDYFLELIRIHFISPWYERISPSPAFPNSVELIIRNALSTVSKRSESLDWATFSVSRLVPLMTDHFHHFRSVEHLASTSSSQSQPVLPLPLPKNSHPALSAQLHSQNEGLSPSIEAHLRNLVGDMLVHILPDYDQTQVVTTIVQEVIVCCILGPVIEMICDSDYWNRQIDERGGRYLHEQKQVNRFLSALSTIQQPDATPLPSARATPHRTAAQSTSISASSSTKHFETFIRSIAKLKTLGEARRLRSDIDREIRTAKVSCKDEVAKADESEEGKRKLKVAKRYVQRLERAKLSVDARIASLSGEKKPSSVLSPESSLILPDKAQESITLYQVLSDSTALAYWLEHMERRKRSRLVQYWLTVEGFKDPLEAAGQDSAYTNASISEIDDAKLAEGRTIIEDVSFLYLAYFSGVDNLVNIPERHRQVIKSFAEEPPTTLTIGDTRKMKLAIYASQKAVYKQMVDEDWDLFVNGELYRKAVINLTKASLQAEPKSVSHNSKTDPVSHAPLLRNQTAPLKSPPMLSTPSHRPRPALANGYFSPVAAGPLASLSITPPTFDRTVSHGRVTRTGSEEPMSFLHSASADATPPQGSKSHVKLGELMSPLSGQERNPLFGEDEEEQHLDHDDDDDYEQIQRMEAIQAALNEIIASDGGNADSGIHATGTKTTPLRTPPTTAGLSSRSVEDLKSAAPNRNLATGSRVHSSTNLANSVPDLSHRRTSSFMSPILDKTRSLFDDDTSENGTEGNPFMHEDDTLEAIRSAAPGDFHLVEEIDRLQDRITDLVKQEHLLENLIRQADLTGNQHELRILHRSLSSLRREQRNAIFQKAQFEQQEEENRLIPGRTMVTIPASMILNEDGEVGKQVVRYTLQIQQCDEKGSVLFGWLSVRRYNEFFELDKAVREWVVTSGNQATLAEYRKHVVELPGKKLVPILSANQVEARRVGLEKYIQSLLTSATFCDSPVVRNFLSRSNTASESQENLSTSVTLSSLAPHNLVKSLYRTMATSLDDALLGPSMLDLMYNSLNRQLADVAGGLGGIVGSGLGISGEEIAALLPSALRYDGTTQNTAAAIPILQDETAVSSFTAPICDLFIELFDLKENKNNWLRKQAIVVILQQFLGSTIERKVRDTLRLAVSPESLGRSIETLQEVLFPDGQRRPPSIPRTEQEKHETRARASKKLGLLIPDLAANMIGKSNARRAGRRVFGALQDRRLNQQLILRILDEVFAVLFPPKK